MLNLAEKARKRAKERCGTFSAALMHASATGTAIANYRFPCKSWSCPRCAKHKTKEISKRAQLVFQKERMRLLTLTIKPQKNISEAILAVNQGWNLLRLKITRKYGKVKYLRILENQRKTKMPHFHILINTFISRPWLVKAAQQCGFGWHLDIRKVFNEGVFSYVLKYLRKGIKDDEFLNALLTVNGRRFGFSRGLTVAPPPKKWNSVRFFDPLGTSPLSALLFCSPEPDIIAAGYYPLCSSSSFEHWFKPTCLMLPPP